MDARLGELDTIAVDPRCWRRGMGRALMTEAVQGLKADGYARAILWTLRDYPSGASFYRATGWRQGDVSRDGGRQIQWTHALV